MKRGKEEKEKANTISFLLFEIVHPNEANYLLLIIKVMNRCLNKKNKGIINEKYKYRKRINDKQIRERIIFLQQRKIIFK